MRLASPDNSTDNSVIYQNPYWPEKVGGTALEQVDINIGYTIERMKGVERELILLSTPLLFYGLKW